MVQIDWEAQRVLGRIGSLQKRISRIVSSLPRLRISRVVSYLVGVLFLLICLISYAYTRRRYPVPNIVPPGSLDGTLPPDFNFHVLVSAQPRNLHLCRTLTSAMILDYPPLTLLKQNVEPPTPSKTNTAAIVRVQSILTFLKTNKRVAGGDLVLVVDSDDTLFQLPPDILIDRYKKLHRQRSDHLRRKYGLKTIGDENNRQRVQKYTQRVLFAARKDCSLNITDSAAYASVPNSPLPPDIYGPKTDKKRDGTWNRPRWLEAGIVMGQSSDLIPLYERMLQEMKKQPLHATDQMILTQMYGNQEYSREIERRRTSSWFHELTWDMLGISEASNITNVRAHIQPGEWHEFGIWLDYEGQLFLNARKTAADIEWLKYRDVRKVSSVQIQHGVPREVRLDLPLDIEQSTSNPFKQIKPVHEDIKKPTLNSSIDVLPPSWNFTWNDIPLATYIQTSAVPAIIHTNGDQPLRQDYWLRAWFHPWARALLRKHVRSAEAESTSQVITALGASDLLKHPARKGGMWTDNDEWMSFKDICSGHEEYVFGDGLGPWGEEKPNSNRPVYNLWGKLMAGKGPKYTKLGESKSEAEEIEKFELGIEDEEEEYEE